jgi:uncharacterized protein YdaU (DUF1376 family)
MNKSPKADVWMPFYIADYLKDTMHLTTEQHGAYVLLIMAAWTSGGRLPDDNRQLAAITRMSGFSWKKSVETLAQFFEVSDGFWTHERVVRERQKADRISETRSEAGQRGGRPPKANAKANAAQNETPSQSPSPEEDSASIDALMSDLDDEIFASPPAPKPPVIAKPKGPTPFDRFWGAYPRKIAKGAAEKAFATAAKAADVDVLVAAAQQLAARMTDPKYTPHAATWLNQKRWLDEPEQEVSHGPGPGTDRGRAQHQDRVGALLEGALEAVGRVQGRRGPGQP